MSTAKTHFKKLKDPNYVGAWDLMDQSGKVQDMTVTITAVGKKSVHDGNGGEAECPVLTLKECKPMVANSTNLKMIAKVLKSQFIEDWVGKKITLTVKKVKAFGEFHDAIRVRDVVVLPELTPTSPRWEGAKKSLQEGNVTIEQIKSNYSLTIENEKLLCSK